MSTTTETAVRANKVKYVNRIDALTNIPDDVKEDLKKVAEQYVFRANDYYLGLIDWDDPADPIRQLIIPRIEELDDWGKLDASNEAANTVSRGVQHKYPQTTLLLCNEVCGAYCRYCFRKRLFMDDNDDASLDVTQGLEYIRNHPEVCNVLLTGGDPLILGTTRLEYIFTELRKIPHVHTIRIGTKMPAFNPWRVLDDPKLVDLISAHSNNDFRIYIIAHFDHPRELTEPAIRGMDVLMRAGAIPVNQCPIVMGVNDDADVLGELFRKLEFIGIPPYYIFQGRPTAGNLPYEVPIVRGNALVEKARTMASGLGRRARHSMSHDLGKIEIVGIDKEHIYMRFHQARFREDDGRFLIAKRDDEAYWLDGLEPSDAFRAANTRPGLPFQWSAHFKDLTD